MNETAFLNDLEQLIYLLIKERFEAKGLPKNSRAMLNTKVQATMLQLNIQYPEYLQYWDRGRKSGGKKVPIMAIVDWIKRKNLRGGKKTVTQLAFAIQTAIWRRGLKPKNVFQSLDNEIIELYLDNILIYQSNKIEKQLKEIKL